MLHPFGGDPVYDWGNGPWLVSEGLVGAGIAAPPGPARRARVDSEPTPSAPRPGRQKASASTEAKGA